MRKAYSDFAIITDEKQEDFIGISLGYDYCSEHEWGIDGIKRDFGILERGRKNMGVKSRMITECPAHLIFKKIGEYALLFTGSKYSDNVETIPHALEGYKSEIKYLLRSNENREKKDKKDPMVTAWSEGSFGIVVKGKRESAWLEDLYNAFKEKNVVIARMNLMPWNPFSNASLCVTIADKLPEEITQAMYDADKEHYDLEDYCKKIGLTKLKEKHKGSYKEDKYYMACSPKWINYTDKEEREKTKKNFDTQYDILIWINYSDDDENHGWYRFEDIKKWFNTKGLKLTQISAHGSKRNE